MVLNSPSPRIGRGGWGVRARLEQNLREIKQIQAAQAVSANGNEKNVVITLSDGKITNVEKMPDDKEAGKDILLPGFIDIHIHGGAGRSVMEGTPDALRAIGSHLARHGVTGYLATTVTAPRDETIKVLRAVSEFMASPENGRDGAAVLGCHLEGPYINPKRKGAQPAQYILPPNIADFERWAGPFRDAIKIVTLAPEMPGALELIRHLSAQGIIISIGHTDATYDQVSAAIDAGAKHVTHCYNAMTQLGSREPGVVGAALSQDLTAELIWDNIHVHPASCRALIEAKTASLVILISDGIPGAGMLDGYEFTLGDAPVTVRDGTARLPDGTLAGSLLTLDSAFRNASEYGLNSLTYMLTYNAARALRLQKNGAIAPGNAANLVLLDSGGFVKQTWVGGRKVYDADEPGGVV